MHATLCVKLKKITIGTCTHEMVRFSCSIVTDKSVPYVALHEVLQCMDKGVTFSR